MRSTLGLLLIAVLALSPAAVFGRQAVTLSNIDLSAYTHYGDGSEETYCPDTFPTGSCDWTLYSPDTQWVTTTATYGDVHAYGNGYCNAGGAGNCEAEVDITFGAIEAPCSSALYAEAAMGMLNSWNGSTVVGVGVQGWGYLCSGDYSVCASTETSDDCNYDSWQETTGTPPTC